MSKVLIMMGSTSDLPKMEKGIPILEGKGVDVTVGGLFGSPGARANSLNWRRARRPRDTTS